MAADGSQNIADFLQGMQIENSRPHVEIRFQLAVVQHENIEIRDSLLHFLQCQGLASQGGHRPVPPCAHLFDLGIARIGKDFRRCDEFGQRVGQQLRGHLLENTEVIVAQVRIAHIHRFPGGVAHQPGVAFPPESVTAAQIAEQLLIIPWCVAQHIVQGGNIGMGAERLPQELPVLLLGKALHPGMDHLSQRQIQVTGLKGGEFFAGAGQLGHRLGKGRAELLPCAIQQTFRAEQPTGKGLPGPVVGGQNEFGHKILGVSAHAKGHYTGQVGADLPRNGADLRLAVDLLDGLQHRSTFLPKEQQTGYSRVSSAMGTSRLMAMASSRVMRSLVRWPW